MTDCIVPAPEQGKSITLAVCVYRSDDTCALDANECTTPCKLRGIASCMIPKGWTLEEALVKLCNPYGYATEAEYEPAFEFRRKALGLA